MFCMKEKKQNEGFICYDIFCKTVVAGRLLRKDILNLYSLCEVEKEDSKTKIQFALTTHVRKSPQHIE